MKTTICTGKNSRFVVAPVPEGVSIRREVRSLYRHDAWDLYAIFTLTPDQAGALIFGIEQALEVGEVAAVRGECQNARICAQEGECGSGCKQRLGVPA